jgi:hypothetical protein
MNKNEWNFFWIENSVKATGSKNFRLLSSVCQKLQVIEFEKREFRHIWPGRVVTIVFVKYYMTNISIDQPI